jgi:hypothetical protein
MFLSLVLGLLLLGQQAPAQSQTSFDINTTLMRSTFRIEGPNSIGTAFILGKPMASDPNKGYYVMVTAAHVLNLMQGETATLYLRTKQGDVFTKLPLAIRIRNGTQPLWTTHPAADVAVMYVNLPNNADVSLISTNLLATDDIMRKFELHPGDRLTCLGYPLNNESNDAGFPVLRSGYIASYPLIPAATVRTFLFDFNVFEGNSGGPVYFVESNRAYGNAVNIGTVQFLVGLVSEQRVAQEQIKSLNELRLERYRLGLAVIIHAALIREALDRLPASPNP